ncbi:hypothetical protein QFC24_006740 [Naganishia onofrii]|uniref:Uncharacterized protein n=1 Tax=Naganishia onofrii TaxID=1851511 RepID=A0ACC2X170_9TREE|nr:hypothetical protein QFC24_006740 [Naganishia onofrii]
MGNPNPDQSLQLSHLADLGTMSPFESLLVPSTQAIAAEISPIPQIALTDPLGQITSSGIIGWSGYDLGWQLDLNSGSLPSDPVSPTNSASPCSQQSVITENVQTEPEAMNEEEEPAPMELPSNGFVRTKIEPGVAYFLDRLERDMTPAPFLTCKARAQVTMTSIHQLPPCTASQAAVGDFLNIDYTVTIQTETTSHPEKLGCVKVSVLEYDARVPRPQAWRRRQDKIYLHNPRSLREILEVLLPESKRQMQIMQMLVNNASTPGALSREGLTIRYEILKALSKQVVATDWWKIPDTRVDDDTYIIEFTKKRRRQSRASSIEDTE